MNRIQWGPVQHDAQLDYYGKRLATCSSDRTIRIFEVVDGKPVGEGVVLKGSVYGKDAKDGYGRTTDRLLFPPRLPGDRQLDRDRSDDSHSLDSHHDRTHTCTHLAGFFPIFLSPTTTHARLLHSFRHTAPIWQISWAHPSFGSILASCSYDSRVYVWKETSSSSGNVGGNGGTFGNAGTGKGGRVGEWEKIKEVVAHSASGESRFVSSRRQAVLGLPTCGNLGSHAYRRDILGVGFIVVVVVRSADRETLFLKPYSQLDLVGPLRARSDLGLCVERWKDLGLEVQQ